MRFTVATRLVLDVILDASEDSPVWGYQIMDASGLGSGTVYPILERLEAARFIEGRWEDTASDAVPRRRYYTATGAGRTWYEQHARGRGWQPKLQAATT